ncbi:MAG: hypothetical protein JNK94_04115 [Hyphomonadaceae bacterium]|nr:hypothetical protein [Hyphomonadaceae bacterium]MBX3510276.1 hypothetical protein [Hyphomonadaceae bacterium]
MRGKGRTVKLNPVDDADHQVHDHPARAGLEALMDQKLFLQRIRSERASAYWFAASLWGVSGLVLGALLGGFMMFQAYVGLSDPVRETLVQGQAIEAARTSVDRRPSLLPGEDRPAQPQQP